MQDDTSVAHRVPSRAPDSRRRWLPIVVAVVVALVVNAGLLGWFLDVGSVRTSHPELSSAPLPTPTPRPTTPQQTTPAPSPSGPGSSAATSPSSVRPQSRVTPNVAKLSVGVVLIRADAASSYSNGTGMVLTPDGLVLTNYHVVEGSEEVTVRIALSGRSYRATVVGADQVRDVALLRLKAASGLATVTFDPDGVAEGDRVIQLGNSGGQGYLDAAQGVVTDLDTSVSVKDDQSPSGRSVLRHVVESTAAAVPGDSGGPMLDLQGQVIGMVTAGNQENKNTKGDTITFHIPWQIALAVADTVRNGSSHDTVRVGGRAFLGLSVDPDDLTITSIVSNGPAAKAGLKTRGRLVEIAGTEVGTQPELYQALSTLSPGQVIDVVWIDRSGARQTVKVTLGLSPTN